MNKFRWPNNLNTGFFGYALISAAFLLFSGCFTGNGDANHRQIDTVGAENGLNPGKVRVTQDTAKKQNYAPPDINEEAMQKAVINQRDSSFRVYNNIRADYRIIGYEKADTNSRKMVLFSVFTSDVEKNPFKCPFGSYYDSALGDELVIKYTGVQGSFIVTNIRGKGKQSGTVYFPAKWVEFDQ